MKIIILQDTEILKEITLTALQFKALRLTGEKPEDYLFHKLNRILEYAVNQARQTIDRISPLTDEEMDNLIDKIEAEKIRPEEERDV